MIKLMLSKANFLKNPLAKWGKILPAGRRGLPHIIVEIKSVDSIWISHYTGPLKTFRVPPVYVHKLRDFPVSLYITLWTFSTLESLYV